MKALKFLFLSLTLVLSFCVLTNAQINLSYLNANTVRNTWASAPVSVDSLFLVETVSSGVVKTNFTLCLTPQSSSYYWTGNGTVSQSIPLDSLEITLYFSLPLDYAATDMFLWVGDEKVRAYIQDRTEASAQYEDIVKRRRDPALLEYYGYGSFNLRIFPCKSFETRKIEIEFIHALKDSAQQVKSVFPVLFNANPYPVYYAMRKSSYTANDTAKIKFISAKAFAGDNGSYEYSIEGMGTEGFSQGDPAVFTGENVTKIEGIILRKLGTASTNPAVVWQSKERNGKGAFGFSKYLPISELNFEEEPEARIFIFDLHRGEEKGLERAKKLAVLSLKKYVREKQKFNIVVSGADLQSSAILFQNPVWPEPENLSRAFSFILSQTMHPNGSTEAGIRTGIEAIGSCRGGLLFLFNNDTISSTTNQTLLAVLKNTGVPLFGFFSDWRLWQLSYESGGMQIGTLDQYYYSYLGYRYGMDSSADKIILPVTGGEAYPVYLPDLFMPNYWEGVRNLQVTLLGGDVLEFAFLQDRPYYGYWYYGEGDVMLAKSSIAIAHSPPSGINLNISGLINGNTKAEFEVKGEYGRRKFKNAYSIDLLRQNESAELGDAIYALQKTENIAQAEWINGQYQTHAEEIKQWGMNYHIVTRQTSLLALEPGMDLWQDMPSTQQASNTKSSGVVAEASMDAMAPSRLYVMDSVAYGFKPSPLDEISLEKLMGLEIDSDIINPESHGSAPLMLRTAKTTTGYSFDVSLQPSYMQEAVRLRIYDTQGRLVETLKSLGLQKNVRFNWTGLDRKKRMVEGKIYFVQISAGSSKAMRKLVYEK